MIEQFKKRSRDKFREKCDSDDEDGDWMKCHSNSSESRDIRRRLNSEWHSPTLTNWIFCDSNTCPKEPSKEEKCDHTDVPASSNVSESDGTATQVDDAKLLIAETFGECLLEWKKLPRTLVVDAPQTAAQCCERIQKTLSIVSVCRVMTIGSFPRGTAVEGAWVDLVCLASDCSPSSLELMAAALRQRGMEEVVKDGNVIRMFDSVNKLKIKVIFSLTAERTDLPHEHEHLTRGFEWQRTLPLCVLEVEIAMKLLFRSSEFRKYVFLMPSFVLSTFLHCTFLEVSKKLTEWCGLSLATQCGILALTWMHLVGAELDVLTTGLSCQSFASTGSIAFSKADRGWASIRRPTDLSVEDPIRKGRDIGQAVILSPTIQLLFQSTLQRICDSPASFTLE
eukprot:c9700_g2_i5.p1 GENE.c9700_g2_i5~~c9700_g2_i5.p1  ORF type:complete len:394 (+),score=69.82 c9700_g2_i5:243-1424(+)